MFAIKVLTSCLAAVLALGLFSTENSHAEGRSKRSRRSRVAALASDSGADSTSSRSASSDKEKEKESRSSGASSSRASSSDGAPVSDKVGRFMANFKIGPAFGAYNAGHQGAIKGSFMPAAAPKQRTRWPRLGRGLVLLGNLGLVAAVIAYSVDVLYSSRYGRSALMLPNGWPGLWSLALLGGFIAIRMVHWGRRMQVLSGAELLASDRRAPIL